MPTGKVKWFNNAKGYGFILPEGGGEDLFAHYSSIRMEGYRTLKAGQTVDYALKPTDKGYHAVDIAPHELPLAETAADHDGAAAPLAATAAGARGPEAPAAPVPAAPETASQEHEELEPH